MSPSGSDNPRAAIKDAKAVATKSARISRREFGLDAAVAATAAAALAASPSSLLTPRRDRDNISPTIAAGEQETAASLKLTPEQSRDVDAKLANIIRKYGERLSEEQRKHLRRILAYNETMLAPIRAFKLPFGVQFIGRALDDHAVIAAARLFQTHSDWHKMRPPVS
jgi:hypothetical protein